MKKPPPVQRTLRVRLSNPPSELLDALAGSALYEKVLRCAEKVPRPSKPVRATPGQLPAMLASLMEETLPAAACEELARLLAAEILSLHAAIVAPGDRNQISRQIAKGQRHPHRLQRRRAGPIPHRRQTRLALALSILLGLMNRGKIRRVVQ